MSGQDHGLHVTSELDASLSSSAEHAPNGDVGLVVIWPSWRQHADSILEYLDERFAILDAVETTWTTELAAESFARFRRDRLMPPYGSALVDSLGLGEIVIVALTVPASDFAEDRAGALGGLDLVSQARSDLLERWPGTAGIYVADDPKRAASDYRMLMDSNIHSLNTANWSGRLRRVNQDLAGAGAWQDVQQMFEMLNTGNRYVVLRNFEGLMDLSALTDHGDIDILVSDYHEALHLLNARSRLGHVPRWGGRFDVRIGSRSVICDIRFPGDGYYDSRWEEELLATRRLHADGFFVPEPEQYLDTLFYHAVAQKPSLAADYRKRLAAMARALDRAGWDEDSLGDRGTALALLASVVEGRGFLITRPKDPTVYFNHRVRGVKHPNMWRVWDALKRRSYRQYQKHVLHRARISRLSLSDRWQTIAHPIDNTLSPDATPH